MAEYRTSLTLSFFYKFYISVLLQTNPQQVPPNEVSAVQKLYEPKLPTSTCNIDTPKRGTTIGDSEAHMSAKKQVTGEAIYTDDIPSVTGELQAYLATANRAIGKIKSINTLKAKNYPGVKAVYTASDVPGNNTWGDIVEDEELFAKKDVVHYGQPVAIVVADTVLAAKKAAKLVEIEWEETSEQPIFEIQEAVGRGSLFPIQHEITDGGDVQEAIKNSENIISGSIAMGGQEQFYFEPMVNLAIPQEGDMLLYSSTQNIHKTQHIVAKALGLPANKVVCKLYRIGGGFGGKETRNIPFSMAAAVAAHNLQKPVRLVLERDLDMSITGGRHPFWGLYCIGFSNEGKIKVADLHLFSNGGCSHDLSQPVLDRALLFCDNCYKIPTIRTVGQICKTNLPSNTAFRGFGGPQGTLFTEYWVDHIARTLNKPVEEIREKNLYQEGELTYYGQPVTKNIKRSWEECKGSSDFEKRKKEVEEFNQKNKWRKRGITLMPSKYGVAFTFNTLNQGAALINVYLDGTVLVTHGGVEMGQGLHTKVSQVVANEFGIPLSKVYVKETASDKIPNSSATAASMGSDIYGGAALKAAKEINQRLAPYRQKFPEASFKEIVNKAWFDRVNLSAQGFFKSEHEGYNILTNRGKPWRYFTLGTACTEVEVDCLTGDHKVLRSDLVVDVGTPINPAIDLGQIEGAFVQGQGWVTLEEMVWGDDQHVWVRPKGRLGSVGPGAYKIPSADDIPQNWNITFMKDTPVPKYEILAVHSSKAVGEPPLLLGISVYFAIREAIMAQRKQEGGVSKFFGTDSPLTSERIRMSCIDPITEMVIPGSIMVNRNPFQNIPAHINYRPKGSF